MTDQDPIIPRNNIDPSINVRSIVDQEVGRLDDLRKTVEKRFDEKISSVEESLGVISIKEYFAEIIKLNDIKYQIQFNAAKDAVGIASTAQEKAMTAALTGTKDALDKADINNDKRFDGISQKIDGVSDLLNKSSGQSGLYVTHSDLSIIVDKIQTSFKTSMESFETSLKPVFAFINSAQATGKGRQDMYGWIVGGVMFLITLISFIIKL